LIIQTLCAGNPGQLLEAQIFNAGQQFGPGQKVRETDYLLSARGYPSIEPGKVFAARVIIGQMLWPPTSVIICPSIEKPICRRLGMQALGEYRLIPAIQRNDPAVSNLSRYSLHSETGAQTLEGIQLVQ